MRINHEHRWGIRPQLSKVIYFSIRVFMQCSSLGKWNISNTLFLLTWREVAYIHQVLTIVQKFWNNASKSITFNIKHWWLKHFIFLVSVKSGSKMASWMKVELAENVVFIIQSILEFLWSIEKITWLFCVLASSCLNSIYFIGMI